MTERSTSRLSSPPASLPAMPPVEIPEFKGPLDLLLHLIQKNEFSIYDIPISKICRQYHEYLETLDLLDLDTAGEFLWMASWLLHMKSRLLLPRENPEDGGADPREELVERLIEYRRVKEFASLLHETDLLRSCLWEARIARNIGSEQLEVDWEDVDLRLLAEKYVEAMDRFAASHPPPLKIRPMRFSVAGKMRELYDRVHQEGGMSLLRHLDSRPDPEEVVTLFVATLELIRLGGVRAEQRKQFAEIYLRPGPKVVDLMNMTAPEYENAG